MKKAYIFKMLTRLEYLLEKLDIRSQVQMAKIEDVQAAVKRVEDAADAEKAQVQAKLDAIASEILDLKNALANGASAADLDLVVAQLDSVAGRVSGIFEPEATAPTEGSADGNPTPVEEAPAEPTPVEEPVAADGTPPNADPSAEVPAEAPLDQPAA